MAATAIAQRAVEFTRQGISRDDAITELVKLADGRREPLEAAARNFVQRLHRRSDDFEATKALRLVSGALDRVGWDTTGTPIQPRRLAGHGLRPRRRLWPHLRGALWVAGCPVMGS
jgi:hypothetical protein